MRTVAVALLIAGLALSSFGLGVSSADSAREAVAEVKAEAERADNAEAELADAAEAVAEAEQRADRAEATETAALKARIAADLEAVDSASRACEWTGRTLNVLIRELKLVALAKVSAERDESDDAGRDLLTAQLALARSDLLETQRELRAECTLHPEDLEMYAGVRALLADLGVTVPPWPADQPMR